MAGILGLTGIPGFLLYLALMLLGGVGIWLKVGGEIRTYFDSWQKVFLDGISQGALVRDRGVGYLFLQNSPWEWLPGLFQT